MSSHFRVERKECVEQKSQRYGQYGITWVFEYRPTDKIVATHDNVVETINCGNRILFFTRRCRSVDKLLQTVTAGIRPSPVHHSGPGGRIYGLCRRRGDLLDNTDDELYVLCFSAET